MQNNTVAGRNFAERYLLGAWQKKLLATLVLILLGVAVWSQRISRSQGFLMDDCMHLLYSYEHGLAIFPRLYLPGVAAHRPIGRDAITLLVRIFGEKDVPIIWTLLFIHVASSLLIWAALYRLTSRWWPSMTGAAFFLLNVSAYLPIYWPATIFDLLSTFFLACLLLSLSLIVQPKGEYRPWLLLVTLPLVLAAVKTKESAIVAVIPLFVMVLLSDPARHRTDPGRFRFQIGELIQRLRKISRLEVVWVVLSVVLVAVLAQSIISDFGLKNPTGEYYSEYSPKVVGRSFGFFLATLAFQTESVRPMRSSMGLVLMFLPLALALFLRNRWMLYGWMWFLIFLLPLATLKNHYTYLYYPYPASIGAALIIAGLFCESEKLWVKWRLTRVLQYLLPMVFITIMVQQSYRWIKFDTVPRWYQRIHTRNALMIRALKDILPEPHHGSEIVLVIRESSQFDQGPAKVLKIIYHDLTLRGALFKREQEAEAYMATSGADYLAIWNGTAFQLKDRSPH